MDLSILILAIPGREEKVKRLCEKLFAQIGDRAVEVLVLLDNKKRKIGTKRQNLLDISQGRYVTFIDDDDSVSGDYMKLILDAIDHHEPDLIVYDMWCQIPYGNTFLTGTVKSSVEYPIDQFVDGGVTLRKPIEVHCWKREIAIQSKFPDANRGEDFEWAEPLWPLVKTEIKIEKALYLYTRERDYSEAYER